MNTVSKISGKSSFYLHLKNGAVDKARMIGLENDRFVEKILFGRSYWQAPIISSRISGLESVVHNITSAKAIEAACGITPSAQTKELRKLMLVGQMIQSHSLHLYLQVLPDYVSVSSFFELQKSHLELFQNAIELKKYADKIIEVIGGRAIHPIANVAGGFKSFPKKSELENLLELSKPITEIAEKTLRLFAALHFPEIGQDLIYSALHHDKEYAFYDGDVWTSSGQVFEPENYTKFIYEELKPYTRAKFGTLRGREMMVGAMARLNNNKFATEKVTELAKELEIDLPFKNPFQNILAQAIENYEFVILSVGLITKFLKNGAKEEHVRPPKKFGIGTAACEAPGGTLFHHYELDKDGFITKCDIITPTSQNLAALESDFKKKLGYRTFIMFIN